MWKYFCFLWYSKNEHSVHSPFVFSLITKCFYKERISVFCQNKKEKFLLKLQNYFRFKNVKIYSKTTEIQKMRSVFSWQESAREYDLLILDNLNNFSIEKKTKKMHNDSLLLLLSPYENNEKKQKWNEIIKSPIFTVTIDTFWFGLAFIRKEQKKQHFIIRL